MKLLSATTASKLNFYIIYDMRERERDLFFFFFFPFLFKVNRDMKFLSHLFTKDVCLGRDIPKIFGGVSNFLLGLFG